MPSRILAGWLFLFLAGPAFALAPAPGAAPGGYFPGQVVVKLRSSADAGADRAQAARLASRFGQAQARCLLPESLAARGRHGRLDAVFVFDYGQGADARALAERIAADPAVTYAEPNYICRVMTAPNDPYYATIGSWGQDYADQWGLHRIGLNPVGTGSGWDVETGQSHPVIVAVIDTGIDEAHADMSAHVWTNPGEVAGNGLDDDNNGYIDDVHGWDFVNGDGDPHDGHGHGTHCSGTIAAMTDNGLGVAGISWGATIMPLKGLSDGGSGGTAGLASAVIYAADNGARVLSNSWGGLAPEDPQVLHDAFVYAAAQGCLAVAAAGNEGNNLFPPYPGKYDEVLAVAATDPGDLKASFSNYGSFVDLAAPGVDILSLRSAGTDMYGDGTHIVGTDYYRASGTSMACPHVAGVAALLWSAHPGWTADEVRQQMQHTADDIEPVDLSYVGALGAGRANARWALSLSARPLVRFREAGVDDAGGAIPNGAADPGETVSLIVTVRNSWLPASNVTATLSSADANLVVVKASAAYGPVAAGEVASNASDPFTLAVSPSCPLGHAATLELSISADGYLWQDRFTLTVASPQLEIRGYLVLDPDGDRDRELDAGETCGLVLRIANGPGGAIARNVSATLSTADAYLTVTQPTASYPDLGPATVGLNSGQPFVVALSPDFPADHVADLHVDVSADGFASGFDVEVTLPALDRDISEYVQIPAPYAIDAYNLQAAVDAQDRLHVIWTHPDEDLGYMVAHREWDSRQWLPRRYVAGNGRTSVGQASLALDAAGQPHFSFNQGVNFDAGGIILGAVGVYYRHRGNGWGPTASISNTPGHLENNGDHCLGIDGHGDAHIVWRFDHYSESGGGVDQTLFHSRCVAGTWQWPAPIVVNPQMQYYFGPKLLPVGTGPLWLMYRHGNPNPMLAYRVWDGSVWSAQQQVPTDGLAVSDYDAAPDAAGQVHVFLRTNENPARLFYRRHAAGTWSALEQIPDVPGSLGMYSPRLHVDTRGTVHLAWRVRTKPSTSTVDQIYSRRLAGGTWTDAEALTAFPPTPSKYINEIAVRVDGTGRRHVLYIESLKGLHHVLASPVPPSEPVQAAPGRLVFQDGRQYPDGSTYSGTRDAHLVESAPLNNAGAHAALETCRSSGSEAGADRTAIVAFVDLDTSSQAGKVLQQAVLTLNYFGSRNDPGGVHKTLSVHRLMHDWGEGSQTGLDGAPAGDGEACWLKPFGSREADNPEWSGTLLDGFANPVALDSAALGGVGDFGQVQFDVTAATRSHLLGRTTNFGFVIRETPGSESTDDGTRQFDSADAVRLLDRPSLTLTFAAPGPGDFDLDGDVDLDDFGHLQACLSGAGVPQNYSACLNACLDGDTDVDAEDLAAFRLQFTSPNVLAQP